MKNIAVLFLILICTSVHSQDNTPVAFSTIKFIYEQNSNFNILNKVLYADTILMKTEFPQVKFKKVENPEDLSKIIAAVEIQSLNKEDKKKVKSQLYHGTHTINGIFDVKKNKTYLSFKRGNAAISKTFIENFATDVTPFAFNIIIDYDKKIIIRNYPNANYSNSFSKEMKEIKFIDSKPVLGTFSYSTVKGLHTDLVEMNIKNDAKITTDIIFTNNKYGVDKVISLYTTTTLKSVIYE